MFGLHANWHLILRLFAEEDVPPVVNLWLRVVASEMVAAW
jgi:hypothetical protein